jgi:glutamate synthase (ferredoxin)
LAKQILTEWESYVLKFKKVLPEEYRQALLRLEEEQLKLA